MIPIFIPIVIYPQYVKSAELNSYIQKSTKRAKIGLAVGTILGIIVQIVYLVIVAPGLLSLYKSINEVTLPTYWLYAVIASIVTGLFVSLIFFLTSEPLDKSKVEQLKQMKDELITIKSPLIRKQLLALFWGYYLLFLAVLLAPLVPIVLSIK